MRRILSNPLARTICVTRFVSAQPTLEDVMQAIRGVSAEMKGLETKVSAELKEVRGEIKETRTAVREDTHSWFKMNERYMQLSCVIGFGAFGYTYHAYHDANLQSERAYERAQTTTEIVAGSMSGDVFTKNVKRAAKEKKAAEASKAAQASAEQ